MAKEGKDKELDILLANKELKIGDKLVVVKRFSLLDTIRIASHLSSLAGMILNATDATATALNKIMYNPTEEGVSEQTVNSIRFMGMLELIGILGEEGADLMADIIAKGTNLDRDEVEEIDAIDGVDVLFTLYEVNKGFFTKFMNKLEKKMPKAKKEKKESVKQESEK